MVLIADSDVKNLQILKDNLEASGFLVATVTNGIEAWEEILRTPPNLILSETNLPRLTGYQLLERINSDPKTSSIPFIFLTKQREIQQRIKSFEMGAKDYLVKPLHVKEVIAHIRMILRRFERHKNNKIEKYKKFSGRLDQLSLADLIESFGVERKTGILTVSNGRRTGQLYFRKGLVVNANLDDFKSEQAIYQMLPWESGYFNMIFRDIDVPDKISISNLGLLLQGIKRLEIREKLVEQLPSPKTSFTISPTFKMLVQKKKVGNGANNFISLLDGKRNVEHIIDESKLDDLIALKRLVRLYQQGFIKPTIQNNKKTVSQPVFIEPEKKVTFIKKHEKPQEIKLETKEKTNQFEPDKADKYSFQELKTNQEKPVQEVPTKQKDKYVSPFEEMESEKLDQANEKPFMSQSESDNYQPPIPKESNETNISDLKLPQIGDDDNSIEIEKQPVPIEDKKSENDDFDLIQDSVKKIDVPAGNEKAMESSVDEQDENDNIFQIIPKRNQEDLEKEIKPIIDQIEQESKSFERKDGITKPPEAELIKNKPITDESQLIETPFISSTTDFKDLKIKEPDQIFIDEELLKQSSFQMKQEHPDFKESEKSDDRQPIISQETKIPVASELSLERNKIILISIDDDCKDEIMDILTNDNFKSMEISEAGGLKIDLGKIALNDYSRFNLVAVSVEKNLNSFFQSIKQSVAGNIFTFDCTHPETWEYTSYLIHSIWFKFKIPYIIAVMNFNDQKSVSTDVIRFKLDLNENITMVIWDEVDKSAPNKLLEAVTKSTLK